MKGCIVLFLALALALALGSLAACSSEPSGPAAVTLDVGLTTPFTDDGAVLFTITGGQVDSLEAAGYTLYSSRPDPNTLQVIVTGDLTSGVIARLHIADERLVSQYAATVQQAATRSSYTQREPTAYSLTLSP